jgi:hypothetical protein
MQHSGVAAAEGCCRCCCCCCLNAKFLARTISHVLPNRSSKFAAFLFHMLPLPLVLLIVLLLLHRLTAHVLV